MITVRFGDFMTDKALRERVFKRRFEVKVRQNRSLYDCYTVKRWSGRDRSNQTRRTRKLTGDKKSNRIGVFMTAILLELEVLRKNP